MVHAAAQEVAARGVECDRENRFLMAFASANERARLPRVHGVDTPYANRGVGTRAREKGLVDRGEEDLHYLVAVAREGLHDFTCFDVEDLDDACRAANGEKGITSGRTAGPGCGAKRFGLEGEVIVEVGEDFEARFGVWTGDDGFATANDSKDRVNVWGGEGVEIGAVVGSPWDSFGGLKGEGTLVGFMESGGRGQRGVRDGGSGDVRQRRFSLWGIPRGRLTSKQ